MLSILRARGFLPFCSPLLFFRGGPFPRRPIPPHRLPHVSWSCLFAFGHRPLVAKISGGDPPKARAATPKAEVWEDCSTTAEPPDPKGSLSQTRRDEPMQAPAKWNSESWAEYFVRFCLVTRQREDVEQNRKVYERMWAQSEWLQQNFMRTIQRPLIQSARRRSKEEGSAPEPACAKKGAVNRHYADIAVDLLSFGDSSDQEWAQEPVAQQRTGGEAVAGDLWFMLATVQETAMEISVRGLPERDILSLCVTGRGPRSSKQSPELKHRKHLKKYTTNAKHMRNNAKQHETHAKRMQHTCTPMQHNANECKPTQNTCTPMQTNTNPIQTNAKKQCENKAKPMQDHATRKQNKCM